MRIDRFIGILTVLSGVLGGCASALAQISDNVVRIGVLNDQSGVYSDITGRGSVIAAQMAVEDFGGTVLGKPIEIIFADHQNKADVGSSIARKWIDRQGVDAIADVPTSSVGFAIQELTRTKNRVFLNSGSGSSDLTGKACSPNAIAWTFDTYALAKGASALVKEGADSWFLLIADYAFGHSIERDLRSFVEASGGKVVGVARHPLGTSDFASFLLQAKSSNAKVIGLGNAGADTINAIKQASEFGITQSGQKLASILVNINDVNSLGLTLAQGLVTTEAFYWNLNAETRAWSERFMKLRQGMVPNMIQAGVYGSVLHYLKAVKNAGTDEAKAVVAEMKRMPIDDFYTKGARIREDGRVMRDMYVFQVKAPSESKEPFDYYRLVRTIPGEEAFRPLKEGGCPYVGPQ
ncbi:ABC transporter substrate-binding protein [Bradyrhizobium sp. Ash2021]|uniref:ABC transporter substrate-binding protein n=1 Tax=Bradyrhizobium sp. Ash2021 TaxID=2954771 RepID=UPI00281621B8|nr:ABC transporter substrate-binding protein [Bradyrhizobium sp. Ash2021]WMT76341.1 ABC transporter substrate-binding protein [Bradyrhizobium sp. Ash2021]WMT76454.1 ABC transporter substrate-binding protein [Bradyrhizobium sp. Ash2021]